MGIHFSNWFGTEYNITTGEFHIYLNRNLVNAVVTEQAGRMQGTTRFGQGSIPNRQGSTR
jgi:hypothetical protein